MRRKSEDEKENYEKDYIDTIVLFNWLCNYSMRRKKTEREKFTSFLGEEETVIRSKSGIDMCVVSLDKENSSNPKVVIQISPNESLYTQTYNWMCLSATEQKEDLKDFDDKVISYAKEEFDTNEKTVGIATVQIEKENGLKQVEYMIEEFDKILQ